jgi:iron complex transport system permease protein
VTPTRAGFAWVLVGACAALVVLVACSFAIGPFGISPGAVWRALWSALTGSASGLPENIEAVVLQVRAPRIAAALAVGAALAGAGAAFQGLFKNPLVSPDILGVSAGSALGAGLALLNALPVALVQSAAFAGGLIAVALVLAVARGIGGRDPLLTLVLTGVAVGSLFGAGIALLKLLADPYNELPALTFWLMGSFAGVLPRDLAWSLGPIALGMIALWLLRWRIDVLTLSEDEARSLGVRVPVLRLAAIVAATVATASSVALAGTIGWVGLLVPHAARLFAGAAFARVLPLSLVAGAGFMLAVDTACRAAFPTEVPPGIVTAFAGTPVFVLLLALTFRRAP